jgi:hypothetical protein
MPQVLKILNNNLLNLTDHRESSFSFLPFKILILLLRYNYMMLTCKVKFSNTFTLYGVQNQFLRFDYVTCKSCSKATLSRSRGSESSRHRSARQARTVESRPPVNFNGKLSPRTFNLFCFTLTVLANIFIS